MADYDRLVSMKPDLIPAYIPRAEIKLARKDTTGAVSDLETVDRMAPKSADLRLKLADLYAGLEHFPAAIGQYTLWIENHPHDARLIRAVAGRCLSRALQDQDLAAALDDCNLALRRVDPYSPNLSSLYTDRGLVRLRQGDYARAIADFADALKRTPNDAAALYGRAIAVSRTQGRLAGDTDLQAARRIEPQIAARFERYGIVP